MIEMKPSTFLLLIGRLCFTKAIFFCISLRVPVSSSTTENVIKLSPIYSFACTSFAVASSCCVLNWLTICSCTVITDASALFFSSCCNTFSSFLSLFVNSSIFTTIKLLDFISLFSTIVKF